jgi:hypothetical protein
MSDITIENNEFLRQFEVKVSDSLARIEYAEQERKIFLTKIHIPDIIKVLEFIESKNLRVVPTSPRIAGFVRKNKSFKHLLPVGIKL